MEIAPVQKLTPTVDASTWAARSAIPATATPVATELASPATVQQASAGAAASDAPEKPPGDGQSPVVERSLSIDPDTQQIVYQAINSRGEIVLQLPDQVVMRQRAYAKDLESAAETSARPGSIERFV